MWNSAPFLEIAAVAVTKDAVLVSGVDRRGKDQEQTTSGLTALSLTDGKVLWKQPLPAPPVLWGLAVDKTGRDVVTLTDGRVLGFGAK